MKKGIDAGKPICGYPRLVIFRGEWSHNIYLDNGRPLTTLVDVKRWHGALVITETGHCFKIKHIKNVQKITPWYLRGWFRYTHVRMEEELEFCQFISFDNVYPILWEAIKQATYVTISLNMKRELINYTPVCPSDDQSFCQHGGYMSIGMKRSLEKQLEAKTSLRFFFEYIVLSQVNK